MYLWNYLSQTDKTIVMYGMGNGADKILSVCDKYGITVADFFASDEFVRGQAFHGKTVLKFSDVLEKYGKDNLIVLVSFASSLPDVMNNIIRVSQTCETYVPDVPVRGDNVYCEEFVIAHRNEIEESYNLLSDQRSKEVYEGVCNFRKNGRLDDLLPTADDRMRVMQELLDLNNYEVAFDLGAYDGDTARELIGLCPEIKTIYAFEPDRRNFRKLSAYAENESKVAPINAAAWSEKTTLIFDDSGNRNSGLDENGTSKRHAEVAATSVDIIADGRVDYIKYDVEGAEEQALLGSAETIKAYHPDLLVSVYHRTEDLFKLILLINKICPEYNFYLRRYPYIPAWDLNLIATTRKI